MGISVAELTASLELQLKGFTEATNSLTSLTNTFTTNLNKMDTVLKGLTQTHEKVATSAKASSIVMVQSITDAGDKISFVSSKISKDQMKAAQDGVKSMQKAAQDRIAAMQKATDQEVAEASRSETTMIKQSNILFNMDQAVKKFGATAALVWPASTRELQVLNTAFEKAQVALTKDTLSFKELSAVQNAFTAQLNRSQAIMRQQAAIDAGDLTLKKSIASALLTQDNALLRSSERYKNLIVSVTKSNIEDQRKVEILENLKNEYQKLENTLKGGVLSKPELAGAMNQFTVATGNASREVRATSKNMTDFNKGMNDFGKAATLAMGPLSGVVARIQAFDYLLQNTTKTTALFTASLVGMAVVWYKSIENAAAFELGVTKTAAAMGLSHDQMGLMRKQLFDLSQSTGIATEDLNKIALSAGQAGVSFSSLASFTKVVSQLTKTTDLTASDAADSLIKLATVTKFPLENIQHLGDVITLVGQSSVGGEAQVLHLATELSKAGQAFGFTAEKAIAWGGALADTGQEAEAASTAVVAGMQKIMKVVDEGGKKFDELAKFMGMSGDQLDKTFRQDGTKVLQIFLSKLGEVQNGVDKFSVLQEEGIINVRTTRVLAALSTAWVRLAQHMKEATDVTQNAGTLQNKFNQIMDTASQKNQKVITHLQNISILLGSSVLPAVKWFQDILIKVTNNAEGLAVGLGAISVALSVITGKWVLTKLFTELNSLLITCDLWLEKTAASMVVAGESTASFSIAMGTLSKAFMRFLPFLALYAGYKLLIEDQVDTTKALSDAQEEFNKKYGNTVTLMKQAYDAGDSSMFKKTIADASGAVATLNKQISDLKAQRWGGAFVDEMKATKDIQSSWWADPIGNLVGKSIEGAFNIANKGLDQEAAKLTAMKDKWADVLSEFGVTITSKTGQIFQAIQNMNDKVLSALTVSTYTLFNRLDNALDAANVMAEKGAEAGKRQLKINSIISPEEVKIKNYDSEKGIREYAKSLNQMGEGKKYSFTTQQVASVNTILDDKNLGKDEKLKRTRDLLIGYLKDVAGQIVDAEKSTDDAYSNALKTGKHIEAASDKIVLFYAKLNAGLANSKEQLSKLASGDVGGFELSNRKASYLTKMEDISKALGDNGLKALKKYKDETKDSDAALIQYAKDHGLLSDNMSNTDKVMTGFLAKMADIKDITAQNTEVTKGFEEALKKLRDGSIDSGFNMKSNKLQLDIASYNKSDMEKSIDATVQNLLADTQKVIEEQQGKIDFWGIQLSDTSISADQKASIKEWIKSAQTVVKEYTDKQSVLEPKAKSLATMDQATKFAKGKIGGETSGKINDAVNEQKQWQAALKAFQNEDIKNAAEHNSKLLDLDTAYLEAKLALWDASAQSMTNGIAAMFGKQNAMYKAAFAIEKGFAVAKAALSLEVSIAKAWELGWPMALVAVPTVLAGVGGLMSAIGGINFANGGMVNGPGTGTSDSIKANLSNGEFVMNANATSKNRSILELMNSGANVNTASATNATAPNIVIQNYGSSKQFETQQLSETDIRIICRDEDNKNTRKILHSEASDANSTFRKIINKNLRVSRKIGTN